MVRSRLLPCKNTACLKPFVRNAGVAMSAFLHQHLTRDASCLPMLSRLTRTKHCDQMRVLELGSGCGLVGLTFARFLPGAEVVLTDLPQNKDIAVRNIKHQEQHSERPNRTSRTSSRISFQPLHWKEPLPKSIRGEQFDVLVASDVTYNSDSSPFLVKTMSEIANDSPGAVVIVAMKVRHPSEQIFFDLLAEAGFEARHHATIVTPLRDHHDDTVEDAEKIEVYEFKKSQP